ncbi:MAG: head-tail connector protein [Xanthobacteraceae bacterium]
MPSILLTPPAAEPLTLAEAKIWLRVEHDDDDELIASLITGARTLVEQETRRALITQVWRIVRDSWPASGRLEISPAPLRQVLAVRIYDAAGAAQEIETDVFTLATGGAPGVLGLLPGALPQQPGRALAGIEIDVEVGYGADGSAVPEPLRQAIRLLVAHGYENRGGEPAGNARLPAHVALLIAPYRVLSL